MFLIRKDGKNSETYVLMLIKDQKAMKKSLFTMLTICTFLLALGENESPNMESYIYEVEFLSPAFTATNNYDNMATFDANY